MNRLLLLALLLGAAAAARAETMLSTTPSAGSTQTVPSPAAPPDESPLLTEFSGRFRAPSNQLTALRQRGVSWTEIGNAMSIADRSGRPFADVVGLRNQGLEWNAIAQNFGLQPETVQDDVRDINARVSDFQV